MMRSIPDRSQPVPLIQAMGSSTIEGPDDTLHRVPLVQVTVDDEDSLRLKEIGTGEWLSETFIQSVYGVAPDQLKSFRVSGNAMSGTVEPGERVRGVLWRGESMIDGSIYLLHGPTGVILRRIHLKADTLLLAAENGTVPTQDVPHREWREDYRPLARIVEVLRSV